LGVSRSSYYYYQKHVASRPVDPEDQGVLEWVKKIAETSDHSYGSCRRKIALNTLGFLVSRNKVRNRMKDAGVQVRQRKKFKVTPNSNHKQPVFENLLKREFNVSQSDQIYAADVT
jgi:putative transposase